jgi:hypothetical protein
MDTAFLAIMREAGPAIAVIMFFIWRDYKREQSLGKVIAEMEMFQRTTLLTLLQKTTEAVTACTHAMETCIK